MTRILVLPGIGDIYWVMTMLEDFIRKAKMTKPPTVYVWDFDGRKRSAEYVERIPFVKSGGYFVKPPHPHRNPVFRATYWHGTKSIVRRFLHFDYYIAVNGVLRQGGTIAEASGCQINWYPEMTRTDADRQHEQLFRQEWGKYVMLHFSSFGMFKSWVAVWSVDRCVDFINELQRATGLKMILSGCEWDQEFSNAIEKQTDAKSIAGQTTPDQFFGLLHGATATAGWCGGNTILATTLKKPTLMLWSQFFPNPAFFQNACPPDAWNRWYLSRTVEQSTPKDAVTDFCRLLQC